MQMGGTSSQPPGASNQRLIAGAALAHAIFVTSWWWAAMYPHIVPFSVRVWVVVAWLWLVWPLLLLVRRREASRFASVAVLIGAGIIVPCVPTIFTFTAWSINGFAR